MENFIDEEFKMKTKEITESYILQKYKAKNIDLVLSIMSEINDDNIVHFGVEHGKNLTSKFKKQKKSIIGYDMSQINNLDMKFLKAIQEQHESYEKEYEAVIHFVYIIVKNEFISKSASLIMKMFNPVVPVHIIRNYDELKPKVKEFFV